MSRSGIQSRQMVNGEPLPVALDMPFAVTCCDCRLTHLFVLSPAGGRSVFLLRGYRDEFLTGIARKKRRRGKRLKKDLIASDAISRE